MTAALLAALAVIVAGAVWLYRRLRREAVVDVVVAEAKKGEAADVAKADATLEAERKRGAVDVANDRRFGP